VVTFGGEYVYCRFEDAVAGFLCGITGSICHRNL
jgi:hypothetical protein